MADDIDAMLQGPDQNAPASPAQTNGQASSNDIEQAPEEKEYSELTGSTQDRIRKLVQEKREAQERVRSLESQVGSVPPPAPGVAQSNPEVQNAVRTLDNVGMATKDYVADTVNSTLANLRYEQEMQRLENSFTGSRGEPMFVREEYEDYVKSHSQFRNYLPEDVFRHKMFHEEFLNLELDNKQAPRSEGRTLKPTRTSIQKESLTPESIEQKLASLPEAERTQWLSEHQDEVNSVLAKNQ